MSEPRPCKHCHTMLVDDFDAECDKETESAFWHDVKRCRDVLHAQLAEARRALEAALPLLRHDERGVHYCRGQGCSAGTHNAWAHSEHCSTARIDAEVDAARALVRAALEKPRGSRD